MSGGPRRVRRRLGCDPVPSPELVRPRRVAGSSLAALAAGGGARRHGPDVTVTGASVVSSRVRPGDLFAARAGERAHGIEFLDQARNAGAVAVLTDEPGARRVPDGVPTLVVDDVRQAVGPIAGQIYGHPDRALALLGVTGTSGKTTTAFLLRAGLAGTGHATGLLGTVGTFAGDEKLGTGLTTPEAPDLYAVLAVLAERGMTHAVMEVSSHALTLGRVGGVRFAAAAFTNLSQDHLDFHADMEEYFAAKARLFDGRARAEVVTVDDGWGRRLADRRRAAGVVTVSSAGDEAATWRAVDVVPDPRGGTHFTALGPTGPIAAACRIPGAYNVANILLALAVLDAVGVDPVRAAAAMAQAQVPGRMQRVEGGQDFTAVVDYAHKPAAVEGALRALRPLTAGRLIVVLGCGGDRDRGKRPMMGEAAARGADVLIVTDDNPRREEPGAIRASMLAGAQAVPAAQRAEVREVGSRADAIAEAVQLAGPGDTVLIAGKGHEPGQEIAGVVHPFDDRDVLRAALRRRVGEWP